MVRILGPWGERAITRARPDISGKFRGMFPSEEENMRVVPGYMYHCNAQGGNSIGNYSSHRQTQKKEAKRKLEALPWVSWRARMR